MYFIEKDIEFQNGIETKVYGFHYISRYTVDYINKKVEIEISSSVSKEQWISDRYFSPHVNFYELDKCPDFGVDPANFILHTLVTKSGTLFYAASVEKDYNLINLKRG